MKLRTRTAGVNNLELLLSAVERWLASSFHALINLISRARLCFSITHRENEREREREHCFMSPLTDTLHVSHFLFLSFSLSLSFSLLSKPCEAFSLHSPPSKSRWSCSIRWQCYSSCSALSSPVFSLDVRLTRSEKEMHLLCLAPPSLLPDASNFVTVNVDEQTPLELRCPVALSPDLSIQWAKNNEELDPLWSTSNLSIRRAMLRIHHVDSTDAGLYQCNVVNGFGHVHAQFRVLVQCECHRWSLVLIAGEILLANGTAPTKVIATPLDLQGGE